MSGREIFSAIQKHWANTQAQAREIRERYQEFVRQEREKRQELDLSALKQTALDTLERSYLSEVRRAIADNAERLRALKFPETTPHKYDAETARQVRLEAKHSTLELALRLPVWSIPSAELLLDRGQVDALSTYVDIHAQGVVPFDEGHAAEMELLRRVQERVQGVAAINAELRDLGKAQAEGAQVEELIRQGLWNVDTMQAIQAVGDIQNRLRYGAR